MALGKYYGCELEASSKKEQIKAIVLESLVEKTIVEEDALTLIEGYKSKAEIEMQKEIKLKQMELESRGKWNSKMNWR